ELRAGRLAAEVDDVGDEGRLVLVQCDQHLLTERRQRVEVELERHGPTWSSRAASRARAPDRPPRWSRGRPARRAGGSRSRSALPPREGRQPPSAPPVPLAPPWRACARTRR